MTSHEDTIDQGAKLLVEVTPAMLKTIRAAAVVRQARMLDIARVETEAHNWEFVDAAREESDKSYRLGLWADSHLSSLHPARIDAEWTTDGYGRSFRVREADIAHAEHQSSN